MKLLVLLPRFPYPLDKGDKLRAYHQIVELSKQHDIYLFALSHEAVTQSSLDALRPYCREIHVVRLTRLCCLQVLLAFFKGNSLQLGYWTSHRARKEYAAFFRQVQPDVVYCQMVRTLPTLKGTSGHKVLDFQDALSLNTHRRMERAHGLWRLILRYEEKALQRIEQEALHTFDATTVISTIDQAALSPSTIIVPNGVDTDYFKIERAISHFTICFTGNMSYAPNVDAAGWLVKSIMPLVWKQCPQATVLLAGADPKPAIKALAGPSVTVSGRLPDIREAYASARMFVAPMRIGSGMQNKLLEAMSMGLPCITTSLAATPIGATPGEHLLVGDSAEELANLIVKLGSEELHVSIADAGHRFVQEHYSWPAAVAPLEKILTH